ncbi:MAG: hypothetical protein FD134_1827 [Gallionellaceae bacterium]|nr:MAG: hypothetical protein FD134_1827 [Gallionellaceae bacterium]
MVNRPRDYRWTSHLIVSHEEYQRLGQEQDSRLEACRALFKARLDEEIVGQIRDATNGNYVLGGECFQMEIEAALDRRERR